MRNVLNQRESPEALNCLGLTLTLAKSFSAIKVCLESKCWREQSAGEAVEVGKERREWAFAHTEKMTWGR